LSHRPKGYQLIPAGIVGCHDPFNKAVHGILLPDDREELTEDEDDEEEDEEEEADTDADDEKSFVPRV
jgi:hypothetical protein